MIYGTIHFAIYSLPTHVGTSSQFPFVPHVAVAVLTLCPDTAYPLSHVYVAVSPSFTPVFVLVEFGTSAGFPQVTTTRNAFNSVTRASGQDKIQHTPFGIFVTSYMFLLL